MIQADYGVLKAGQTEEDIKRNVKNSVGCGMAMEGAIIRLNATRQQQGLPSVRMGVGMNTGPVVAGSLGSAQRLKFMTVGDSVNIAARLENFEKGSVETWAKKEVFRIHIGETTKQYFRDHPWELKEVGVVALKGKSHRHTRVSAAFIRKAGKTKAYP